MIHVWNVLFAGNRKKNDLEVKKPQKQTKQK